MSRISFGANTETLLTLALFSNQPQLREAVIQKEASFDSRTSPEIVIRQILDDALYPLIQDEVYGLVYYQLFQYHLDQVDYTTVRSALCEENGVYFHEAQTNEDTPSESDNHFSNAETSLLWDVILYSDRLPSRLKRLSRDWKGDSRRGARILRAYFKLHCPMLTRTVECPFLIQTFLGMSLERINWIEIALHVLQAPVPEQPPLKSEEVEEHDPYVQLAILQEALSLSEDDFGGYVMESWCTQDVQNACLEVSDQCVRALQTIESLKESGRVFRV